MRFTLPAMGGLTAGLAVAAVTIGIGSEIGRAHV